MVTQIALYTFLIATAINLFFWCFIFSKLARYKDSGTKKITKIQHSVSIIICARNEAENLKKNLPHILNQTYRSFEVIVVNDGSSDASLQVLLDFQKKKPYLRIINIDNVNKNQVGKKFALAKGIEAARYDLLLLTDADCCPINPLWLQKMQQPIKDTIEIGLAYGPYYKTTGFLNKFVRFETVYTAIQYFSFALIGLPYMGVGRNLIYHKSLYYKVNGFASHEHIASGDDDLFINQVAHSSNIKIILDQDTFMYSEPKKTWRSLYRQKARHVTTGSVYQFQHKVLLGLLSASHFSFYVTFFFLILKISIIFVLAIYIARIIIILLWYKLILDKLEESSLLKWVPLMDAFFVLYYIVFLPSLLNGKKNQWT